MTNPTQITVDAACTLHELCDALNAHCPLGDDDVVTQLEELVDMAGLPTFGGVPPSVTSEVWSWDADSVLLFNNGFYYVEARDPDAWYDRNN